jgi:hypothetical protein
LNDKGMKNLQQENQKFSTLSNAVQNFKATASQSGPIRIDQTPVRN